MRKDPLSNVLRRKDPPECTTDKFIQSISQKEFQMVRSLIIYIFLSKWNILPKVTFAHACRNSAIFVVLFSYRVSHIIYSSCSAVGMQFHRT